MKKAIFIAATALVGLTGTALEARADSVVEPSTGHAFDSTRTVDGKSYALLGTGVRKKFIVKVYAMALYGEAAGVKKALAAGKPAPEKAPHFVAHADFDKVAILHFVRDVDHGKMHEAYQESLKEELSDKAPPDLKKDAEAFVALWDQDVKNGQEIIISTTSEGKVEMGFPAVKKQGPTSPKLVQAIWRIWLGAKPISADLRTALVSRLEEAGK